ncbi:MAG TPA: class I SAM-dependent methyltransferase [Polyangia bacterium]|nr:class I SAM-dependent methyltransferase [Polyangia bacterium]
MSPAEASAPGQLAVGHECPICASAGLVLRFRWSEPPEGETPFELPEGVAYEREFLQCGACGHLVAGASIDPELIYGGAYVDATYSRGIAAAYERIMALPPASSDNIARVERVCEQLDPPAGEPRTLLDVGSGLGVFGARMKERGWEVTALDPDPRAVEHAEQRIGVRGVVADFMAVEALGEFRLLTLNKVLEHVADPLQMLRRTRMHLAGDGRVYVEVPDGEVAAERGGEGREELFVEHLHAFSAASLALLARRAGFELEGLERLHEPSDKYTLAAFLR